MSQTNAYIPGLRAAVGHGLPGRPQRGVTAGGLGVEIGSLLLSEYPPDERFISVDKGQYLSQAEYPALFAKLRLIPDSVESFTPLTPIASIQATVVVSGQAGVTLFSTGINLYITENHGGSAREIVMESLQRYAAAATDGVGKWIIPCYMTSAPAQIFFVRSEDNGVTWSKVNFTNITETPNRISYLGSGNWLLTCNNSKNYRSKDFGETWQPVSLSITAYDIVTDGNGSAVAWSYNTAGGVYITENFGETWSLKTMPATGDLRAFAVHAGKWTAVKVASLNNTNLHDFINLSTPSSLFSSGYITPFGPYTAKSFIDGAQVIAGFSGNTPAAYIKLPSTGIFLPATFSGGVPTAGTFFNNCSVTEQAIYLGGYGLWKARRISTYNTATTFYVPRSDAGVGKFKAYMRVK